VVLRLYNTRTRKKEDFKPLDPEKDVRMYVCGPTVYDFAHIGNARPVIVFDVLYRLLRHLYGPENVTYARNITDVDDKINARAAEEGVPIRELTERTTAQFHADMAALGCLPPDYEPRATDYVRRDNGVPDMIGMIQQLIDKGCAYEAEGHVLFDVSAWPAYGSLSRRPLDEMRAGARVEVAPYKRGPMDFVLWKPSKVGEPGWESPWGWGRPGWHLECSTMSAALLGETFDIHGGGIDLQFPHHENEVAQSCCAHGTDLMANVWMHNGYLMVEGEKMSKSLGNFITVRGLLRDWHGRPWHGMAVRHAMLMTHYRQPLDWTYEKLAEASDELKSWALSLNHYSFPPSQPKLREVRGEVSPFDDVVDALSDDLNTPAVRHILQEKHKHHSNWTHEERQQFASTLLFLGVVNQGNIGSLQGVVTGEDVPARVLMKAHDFSVHAANSDFQSMSQIETELLHQDVALRILSDGHVTADIGSTDDLRSIGKLIEARNEARKAKNFAEADRIRDELSAMGIQLKDSRDPETGEITTTWEIAR